LNNCIPYLLGRCNKTIRLKSRSPTSPTSNWQAPNWSKLAANAANLSLFASKKLLEIRIPTGKPGTEGGKALEALCARLPEDTVVLVMLPELEWQHP